MLMMAYEIYELQNSHQNIGLGMMVVNLKLNGRNFLTAVKEKMKADGIPILLYRKTIKGSGARWIWKLCDKKQIMAGPMLF
jgi:hypothetical protein